MLCVGTPARTWSGTPREHLPVRAVLKIVENDTSRFTSGRIVNPGVSQTVILAGRPGGVRAVRHQECHPMCGGPSRTGVWRQLNKIRCAARGPGGVRPGHGTCHRLDGVRSCLISAIVVRGRELEAPTVLTV